MSKKSFINASIQVLCSKLWSAVLHLRWVMTYKLNRLSSSTPYWIQQMFSVKRWRGSTLKPSRHNWIKHRFSYLFKFIRYSVMFHCLDLLSQPESHEKKKKKKKKGTNFNTFTTNSPEFFALSEREIEYIVNLCLSKTKQKNENIKENSRFCKCLFMITIRKQYCGLHLFPKLQALPSQSYAGWDLR